VSSLDFLHSHTPPKGQGGRRCSLQHLHPYLYPPPHSITGDRSTDTKRTTSGDAQPRPLLDAPTTPAPPSDKLRRRHPRQHNNVHVLRERRTTRDASAHAGSWDDIPTRVDAHDDEHRYVNLTFSLLVFLEDEGLWLRSVVTDLCNRQVVTTPNSSRPSTPTTRAR
jgi:hypothetical protein